MAVGGECSGTEMPWTPPDRSRTKRPAPTVRTPPPPRGATPRTKRAPVWMSQYVGETDMMTNLGRISSARTPQTGDRGGGSGGDGLAVQDGGEVQGQGEEAGAGGVEGVETEPPDTTVGRCARWVEIRLHTKRI